MDLFSKIIKRPLSLTTVAENNDSSSSTAAAAASAAIDATTAATLVNSRSIRGGSGLLSLTELLDSAAQDINQLEEHHKNLIVMTPPVIQPATSTSRDTIQQLLSAINVNLNQVSAHEMEHLQAMSAELSPLAVKANPKLTMDQPQQKIVAAAAALRTGDPLKLSDTSTATVPPLAPSGLTFAGLPEFDETQIPELAPLSADMLTVHLKTDSGAIVPLLNSSHDYNSDSDVFVECLSLNSDKRYSNDPAELEAYKSAINDGLENQEDTNLNNTLSEGNANADCSYEPMDVDELNETMEILKDVMDPEDHQLLKEQLISDVVDKAKQILTSDPLGEVDQAPGEIQFSQEEKADTNMEAMVNPVEVNIEEQPLEKRNEPQLEEKEQLLEEVLKMSEQEALSEQILTREIRDTQREIQEQSFEKDPLQLTQEEPLPKEDQYNVDLEAQMAINEPNNDKEHQQDYVEQHQQGHGDLHQQDIVKKHQQTLEQLEQKEEENGNQLDELQSTPSVPVDLQENVERPQKIETNDIIEKQEEILKVAPTVYMPVSPPIPTHRPKTAEELAFLALKELPDDNESQIEIKEEEEPKVIPIAFVTPTRLPTSPIQLLTSVNSTFPAGPISPTFPVKDPAEPPSHFPHSPHAPAEKEEMPYLEQAVIERSSEDKLSMFSGVIAKSPVPINVIEASPDKKEVDQLNETLPMEEIASPLSAFNSNATFDSASDVNIRHSMEATAVPVQPAATFCVPLKDINDQQRRTFTVEDQVQPRRTFCLNETQQIKEYPFNELTSEQSSRLTFTKEPEKETPSIGTFAEASEDFEPMDVDTSVRIAETTVTHPPPLSPPIPTFQNKLAAPAGEPPLTSSPPIPTHQTHELKRPPIHNATMVLDEQTLSAKEQATLSASDEKDDVFMEHFGAISPVSDDMFKAPQYTSSSFNNLNKLKFNGEGESSAGATRANIVSDRAAKVSAGDQFEDGGSNNNIILNSSDFDYLYTKGNNNTPVDRSSLLLKFDPLLGAAVPINTLQQQEQALSNIIGGNVNNNRVLSPTLEEHETSGSNQSFAIEPSAKLIAKELEFKPPVDRTKKHAKMSVDVIDNDCNKTFDNSNLNTEDKANNYHNMDELEKKIKNEVTRSEDIEKKLRDAEQREEALIKRITEKDKTNSKLNGVIEAYEKAIAELISEKEQLVQNYERQLQEVQADRDSNYQHLTSLETTFSDLHIKYEKSKEMTSHLRQVESTLLAEKKQTAENLQLQEQRYEKMKSHAMQQLEIANKKLDSSTKEHADEVKKLKALLKKEEISRVSTAEQLQQKSRENADLLKICEELIYGKGQGGSS